MNPVSHSIALRFFMLANRQTLRTVCIAKQWGLVPRWTKADAPEKPPLINARRETIKDLPSFAGSLPRRRCVVVSTGFFEWEKGPTKSSKKTPFLINMGTPAAIQNVLFFAGVYDTWVSPDGGEPLYSFTICTTHASEQFAWLHHRLPCILPTAKDVADWLNVDGISGPDAADALLKTLPSGLVWRQMSQDLDRAVAAPRSRHVKPDVKKYFSAGPSEAKKPLAFPMSFAERVGYSQIPPLNKLDSLDSPIKKKASRKTASGSKISPKVANKSKTPNAKGLGASPKKEEKPGQRKITSFFTKKE